MRNTEASKKAICSFLGQSGVFDTDLKHRLSRELFALAEQHEAVEFLFHNQADFLEQCFVAALMTKQHFPEKEITLTLVQSNEERKLFLTQMNQRTDNIFRYFIDRCLIPQIPYTDKPLTNYNWVSRWVIQQSTHVVCLLYREMDEISPKRYRTAKRAGCTFLDVSSKETAAYLTDRVCCLPEQDRTILQKRISGEKKTQIGAQLGLGVQAVNRSLSRSTVSLRKSLQRRVRAQREEDVSCHPVCGIFSKGEANYETLRLFRLAVSFLVRNYSISRFLVAAECYDSEYMHILDCCAEHAEITIAAASEWTEPSPSFFPRPYQNVEILEDPGTADPLWFTKALLERTDFCICNLAQHPHAEQIRSYLTQIDDIMVLDLGQASSPQRLLTH